MTARGSLSDQFGSLDPLPDLDDMVESGGLKPSPPTSMPRDSFDDPIEYSIPPRRTYLGKDPREPNPELYNRIEDWDRDHDNYRRAVDKGKRYRDPAQSRVGRAAGEREKPMVELGRRDAKAQREEEKETHIVGPSNLALLGAAATFAAHGIPRGPKRIIRAQPTRF